MSKTTITKRFANFPFAHRQPNHTGHCHLIHGHNWDFEFEFACDKTDVNNFVVDFGDLKWLREKLNDSFDHTLVLNEDDPWLSHLLVHNSHLESAIGQRVAKIVVVPNCGAEGLAEWLTKLVNDMIRHDHPSLQLRGVRVVRTTVYEDEKNSATHTVID